MILEMRFVAKRASGATLAALLIMCTAWPSFGQVPRIERLDPAIVDPGGRVFTLRILGANFVAGTVNRPGTMVVVTQLSIPRATTFVNPQFVNSGEIQIPIEAALIAKPERLEVKVSELDSGKAILTVRGGPPPPPQALNFFYQIGARRPTPKDLPMPTAERGEPFRAEILDTLRPTLWLTVRPPAGTVGQAPTVAIDPTDLPQGEYRTRIRTVVGQGNNQRELVSSVRFSIEMPARIVIPRSIAFRIPAGSLEPMTRIIPVTARDGGRFGFGIALANTTRDGDWLTVSSSSTTTPAQLNLTVTPTKLLGAGLHLNHLLITENRAECRAARPPLPSTFRPQQMGIPTDCEPTQVIPVWAEVSAAGTDNPLRLSDRCVWIGDRIPVASPPVPDPDNPFWDCVPREFRQDEEARFTVRATGPSIPFDASLKTPGADDWLNARIQKTETTFEAIPALGHTPIEAGTVAEVRGGVVWSALATLGIAHLEFRRLVEVSGVKVVDPRGVRSFAQIQANPGTPSLQLSSTAIYLSETNRQVELRINSTGGPIPFNVSVPPGSSWFRVSTPSSPTTTPGTVVVSSPDSGAVPSGLSGSISITSPVAERAVDVSVSTFPSSGSISPAPPVAPSTRVLSQVVGGRGWSTRILLANVDRSSEARVSLTFWPGSRSEPDALLRFLGVGNLANSMLTVSIAPGGVTQLETDSKADQQWEGWVQITGPASVGGTAIFRQSISTTRDIEGAVPLRNPLGNRFLLAFDNTSQGGSCVPGRSDFITSIAIANTESAGTRVTVAARDESGSPIVLGRRSIDFGARGHNAFELTHSDYFPELSCRRGVVEFSATTALSALGLRFNRARRAFTSLEPVTFDPRPASQYVAQIADGGLRTEGLWQTSLTLVNTAASPVTAQLRFVGGSSISSGRALRIRNYTITDSPLMVTVPAGGSATLETEGAAQTELWTGWLEVSNASSLAGFAVFRSRVSETEDAEGAAPLSVPRNSAILIFEKRKNYGTSLALAMPDGSTNLRGQATDDTGRLLPAIAIPGPSTHLNFLPRDLPDGTGLLEFTGPNMVGIGLLFNGAGAAFTSLPVLTR